MTTAINFGALKGIGKEVLCTPNESGVTISIDQTIDIQINCFFPHHQDSRYSLNNYSAWIAYNKDGGQEQLSALKKNKTFGYILPVNSLIDGTAFTENEFSVAYARAAIESIFFKGIADHQTNDKLITEKPGEICISELILSANTTSIVVVHNGIMTNENISKDGLFISLAGRAITQIEPENESHCSASEYSKSIIINCISKELAHKEKIIQSLLTLATNQKSPFSKYLMIYQIIEILINDIFTKEMESIKSDEKFTSSAWNMKKKLSEITAESHRISLLHDHYQPGQKDQCFSVFTDKVSSFLQEHTLSEVHIEVKTWPQAVYKLRNSIVHNQGAMLDSDLFELESICHYFRQCCIKLTQNYTKRRNLGGHALA